MVEISTAASPPQIGQDTVHEYPDLGRRGAAHSDDRILPLAVHFAHMDTGNHFQKVREIFLLPFKFLRTDDRDGTG